MTVSQRALVQCPKCHNWYVVVVKTMKYGYVRLEDLADAETTLGLECNKSKHRGRRKATRK